MASATAVASVPARTEPGANEVRLRTRWLEQRPDGQTRRDEVLRALRGDGDVHPDHQDLRGISLIGESLEGVDLTGCDLSGADLSEADLTGAKLARCESSLTADERIAKPQGAAASMSAAI